MKHENSHHHQKALKHKMVDAEMDDLPLCTGLPLGSDVGQQTPWGTTSMQQIAELWARAGCIGVKGAVTETVILKEISGAGLVLKDVSCEEQPKQIIRGGKCCATCWSAAHRKKLVTVVREWSYRIAMTDLTHCTLMSDRTEQINQANFIRSHFPEDDSADLASLSYSNAILKTKQMFLHIPVAKQNDSLRSFISRSLKFLSPTMVVGLSSEVKTKIQHYVEALAEGRLQQQDSDAIVA